jgi:hypothetical protein
LILDLGCGTRKREGAVGVDYNPNSAADVIHDLGQFPYPFETSSADEIYLDNVLEHLPDVVATLDEIHRIGRDGCQVRIDVPYFRSRWASVDPTHRHSFTADSMSYFDPAHSFFERYHYSESRFGVESVTFNERFASSGPRAWLARFANRWPARYEAYLAPAMPLDELTFKLRVIK